MLIQYTQFGFYTLSFSNLLQNIHWKFPLMSLMVSANICKLGMIVVSLDSEFIRTYLNDQYSEWNKDKIKWIKIYNTTIKNVQFLWIEVNFNLSISATHICFSMSMYLCFADSFQGLSISWANPQGPSIFFTDGKNMNMIFDDGLSEGWWVYF